MGWDEWGWSMRQLYDRDPGFIPTYDLQSIDQSIYNRSLEQDAVVFLLEPFLWIGFRDFVTESNLRLLSATVSNIESRSSKNNIEIHTVNTNAGIVFDSEIDMFGNSKPEVSSGWEVSLSKLVFFHFQSLLKDLLKNIYFFHSVIMFELLDRSP